jgi:hypothetical protein
MATTVTCPACRAALQVGSATVGQQVRCPRCQALIRVPSDNRVEVAITEEPPAAPAAPKEPPTVGPTRSCPACGQPIAVTARKCRHCKAWIEEEDEDREYYRSEYKPCPRCGARGATRVVFTFWGSFYGPALFTHVRCPECQYAYNGRTGRSNTLPAVLFVAIPALLILGIIGGLIWLIARAAAP